MGGPSDPHIALRIIFSETNMGVRPTQYYFAYNFLVKQILSGVSGGHPGVSGSFGEFGAIDPDPIVMDKWPSDWVAFFRFSKKYMDTPTVWPFFSRIIGVQVAQFFALGPAIFLYP